MRRFAHGLGWGAAATLVMGTVSLLLFAVGAYGTAQPLSVMLARNLIGATRWALVLAAIAQLAYGALCGGLLAVLSSPVTVPSALGLGAMRWMITQVMVLPAFGWAEFGLMRNPWLAMVTVLPHLAWALSIGWLMHRDDEHVVPVLPHFHLRLHPARIKRPSRLRRTRYRV